jgi:hypothetical protein
VRVLATALLAAGILAGVAVAASERIPKPTHRACGLATTAAVTKIVGAAATRQPGPTGFQTSIGPGSHRLLISLCVWTYGKPDPNAPTPSYPTAQITYFAASSVATAKVEYIQIRAMLALNWRALKGVGDVAATSPSAPTGQTYSANTISRHQNQILATAVGTPTEDATSQSRAVALLKAAARVAWPRR